MVNSLRFTKSDKVDLSTAVNHRKRFKVLLVISFIWFTFCVVDRLLVNANRNRKMRPSSGSKSSPVNRFPKVNLQVEEIKTYDVRAVEFQMSRFHLGRNDIVKNLKKKHEMNIWSVAGRRHLHILIIWDTIVLRRFSCRKSSVYVYIGTTKTNENIIDDVFERVQVPVTKKRCKMASCCASWWANWLQDPSARSTTVPVTSRWSRISTGELGGLHSCRVLPP